MKISDIKKVLPFLIEAKITPNIIGEHGKGKSEVIAQFAAENGYSHVVNIRLGQISDPSELVGLPEFVTIDEVKRTKYIVPTMFPMNENSKVVVFLDEYNRCPPQTLQAVFQLMEKESRLGEYILPKDCAVILASNPPTDEYTVTDLQDKALMDRMLPIKFEPTRAEWFDYMNGKGADASIIAFLRDQETALEVSGSEFSLSEMVSPSRRSWDSANRLLAAGVQDSVSNSVYVELLGGLVGPENAVAFDRFTQTFDTKVKAVDLLKNYTKLKAKIDFDRTDEIQATLDELKDLIVADIEKFKTKKAINNFYGYLLDIPKDLAVGFFDSLVKTETKDKDGNTKMLLLDKKVDKYIYDFNGDDALYEKVKGLFFGSLSAVTKDDDKKEESE